VKIKTQILCSLVFFNRVIYETTWKSILEPGRSQMTVRLICISYWINEATDTTIICNMYCFCTAEMVARTHVTIKLYVHCQVSFFLNNMFHDITLDLLQILKRNIMSTFSLFNDEFPVSPNKTAN
jgi:hypothetical protein